MTASEDPLVGRTIAQYLVVARVGGGAMGVVYQARDTRLGRVVALKFLPQQWSHDETAKQRFVREAQAASATNHPNICTIHDIETAPDGQLFIVMAFYEGPTLKQRIESGPIGIEDALDIATQIADGLAKAHAQGVVHRDIKPGNVILTEEGVRILDFGLATFVDALKLTVENTSFGTPAYMSPEQVRGQSTDARTDVWAVGVVLYEMLAGHVPFQGAYAEAVTQAVRHESPAPLRSIRPEIAEEVEQLVFRALHKDANVRFPSGRELARALRLMRGLSVPIELRTAPVVSPRQARRQRIRPRVVFGIAAALTLVAVAVAGWWVTRPIQRVSVVVAPVSNQTGFDELQPFRLALTNLLTMQLSDADSVRVIPYDRVLQILRRFLLERSDVASRAAVEAVGAKSGATYVLVPTLLYDNGMWRARIEIRAPATGLNVDTFETAGVSSSIATDTAFGFMRDLATHVNEQLSSPRARVRRGLRFFAGDAGQRSVRSLDAASLLEEGLNAYDRLEYAEARRAFMAAAGRDRRSPLVMAWLTRVDMLMRQDEEAAESAARALAVIDTQTPRGDALFTEAVAAEARAEHDSAEDRYRELVRRHADEPGWLMELAAFQDRRTKNAEAIATYHQALALDAGLTRAHLELCRLYSPNRTNEPARAKAEVEQALTSYRELGDRAGEAQALFCLVDILRVGSPAERTQALAHAYTASTILADIKQEYNLARADNYIALIAGSGGDMPTAVKYWEQALESANATGNRVLAPRVMNNLGVAYQAMGDRTRAVELYRQSYALNEKLGDQQEAARTRANAAAILIDYGNIEDALREVQSAQRVAQKLTDKAFEVLCLQLVAAYYRQVGRYDEATRTLSQALSVATDRGLASRAISSTIDMARLHVEMGRYESARELLTKALIDESGREASRARAVLGLLLVRLGNFTAADAEFSAALKDSARRGDLLPFVHLSMGELAYERGQMARAREELRLAAAVESGAAGDAASTEAAALADVLFPAVTASSQGIDRCIEDAQRNGRVSLLARCRLYRARALMQQGRTEAALQAVAQIPLTEGFDPGPEMRAQIHHWRAEALARSGRASEAAADLKRARDIIDTIRQSLRPEDRDTFAARRDLRAYSRN